MKYNLLLLVFFCSSIVGYAENKNGCDLILVGIHHPFHKYDDIILPRIADSLNSKSDFFSFVESFATGKEMLEILKRYTKEYGKISNLVILGHSGYQGYFVEANSGFHRDDYQFYYNGKPVPLTDKAAKIKDLKMLIQNGDINFDPSAIVILAGCNTAYGDNNIAYDIADITGVCVIGTDQKIDVYNVLNQGEEFKGLEGKTFMAFIPNGKNEMIQLDFKSESLFVSDSIKIIKNRLQN